LSWLNPYTEPRVELRSSLSPLECCERLKGRLARWLAWGPSPERPLKGRVTEAGFAINRVRLGRNGFETQARGRFEPDPMGTRIAVRFGLKPADVIFVVVWILLVSGVGTAFLFAPGERDFPGWVPFLAVLWLGLLYVAIRWSCRGDAEFLVGLIRETLSASLAQEQAPIE
jgi:hypothetical protein